MSEKSTIKGRVIALLMGTLIFLTGSEIVLRTLSDTDANYYIHPPNTRRIFRPIPEIMPGVSGESEFKINAFGIRGDAFSRDQDYRILTIGGSTTICFFLDESEAWPYRLQRMLNTRLGTSGIWVGNAGKRGLNTREHIVQVQKLLPQYPKIDAIILLIGINDLLLRLGQDVNYRPFFFEHLESPRYDTEALHEDDKVWNRAFHNGKVPGWDLRYPFYKRTEIWRNLRKAKQRFLRPPAVRNLMQYLAGKQIISLRQNRKNASAIRNILPDLSTALEEYARNVNRIIDLAENRGTRVIFVTQPVMWKSGLSKELNSLLWLGGIGHLMAIGDFEYYSIEVLAQAMGMYNEALLTICRKRKVECVDLASLLPKDTTVFYDDAHFNESGSRKVAAVLSNYLLEHDPFKERSSVLKDDLNGANGA